MSSGRKVVVTMTQAEAQAILWAHGSLLDANGVHADWAAFDRAFDKVRHQLNAVRGKAAQRTDCKQRSGGHD